MPQDAPHIRDDRPSASWMHPSALDDDRFSMRRGKILLGKTKSSDRVIGLDDNRHLVTIAGSRAGKSATSLIPNLLMWDGSAIVIDPKGELATHTASIRARMGQEVYILDPFGEVKTEILRPLRRSYNPLDGLRSVDPDDAVDEAATLADALITTDGNKTDHWTLSAKNLIRGLILYALHEKGDQATLNDVRHVLTLADADDSGKAGIVEEHIVEAIGRLRRAEKALGLHFIPENRQRPSQPPEIAPDGDQDDPVPF